MNSGLRPPGALKPNEAIKQFFTGSFFPVVRHMFQILPDAAFVFIVLFSILTQNFAFGVLSLTLVESTLAFLLIGSGVNYFAGAGPSPGSVPDACQAGFPSSVSSYATLSLFNGFTASRGLFPSQPVALVSTLIGYVLTALYQYAPEFKQLGHNYELRTPLAITLGFLVLTAFVLFRYIAGCENLGVLMGTVVIGILMGTILTFQNVAVLGKESVNLIGVPTLESRTIGGKPLYVCAKAEKSD
jgi:hypothetical protein